MTPVSSLDTRRMAIQCSASDLARCSLVPALMSLLAVGCVDPPPEYAAPERLPPVVTTTDVYPSLTQVTTYSAQTEEIVFTVPFRSDDAGEDLRAFFVLDIGPTQDADFSQIKADPLVPADPRPFADQADRQPLEGRWKLNVGVRPSGCHTMTMVLSHATNFDTAYHTVEPLDEARVTWWLDLQPVTTDGAPGPVCWPNGVSP
jgi:hypothetical protein